MEASFRPGDVVLFDNNWDHNEHGRPHIVLKILNRDLILCPLSTAGHGRAEAPLPPRVGGLRYRSWVAATDVRYRQNNLRQVRKCLVGRLVCKLTAQEFHAAVQVIFTQRHKQKKLAKAITPS
jgi:hypothetical protein